LMLLQTPLFARWSLPLNFNKKNLWQDSLINIVLRNIILKLKIFKKHTIREKCSLS
jgi:hypothetical protein